MHKRIVIIHPSEICRKGIQAILRDGFDYEFTLLENLQQLNDYSALANYDLVVLLEESFHFDFKAKYQSNLEHKNNQLYLFKIVVSNCESSDFCICLKDNGNTIINKIKTKLLPEENKVNGLSELSEREVDVLRLVALGFANKDIAEKLFISIHTVITHRKHITEKLGIKSISGLTVYAILNKLIDTDNIDPSTLI